MLVLAGLLALVAGTAGGLAVTGRSMPFLAAATSTSEGTGLISTTAATGNNVTGAPSSTSTTSTTTTTMGTAAETVEDVVADVVSVGWYASPSTGVSASVLDAAVRTMADYGEEFGVVVMATEPVGGVAGFADDLAGSSDKSIVLVIAAGTAGWSGRPALYNTDQVDAALDAVLDSPGPAAEDLIVAFVEALVASDSGSTSTTVPEDLGLDIPMSNPECDGRYVVFFGAAVDPELWEEEISALLEAQPDSQYLRTDVTGCTSLRFRDEHGQIIYAAFVGPYDTFDEACDVRADLPQVRPLPYVKRLDDSNNTASLPC